MTTALRSIDCTPATDAPALVPAAHVHDLIAANARLERDLASARARNATLMRELRRAVQAPKLVGQGTVGGMLTITYDSGRVVQLQPTASYTEDSTEYAMKWIEITPAPDTPKAIVDAAIEAVENDEDDVEERYDPTFRTLAGLALHGMAVSAGSEQ